MFQESRNNHRKRRLYVPYLLYYYYKSTPIVKAMMQHGHQRAVWQSLENQQNDRGVFSFCVLNSWLTKSSTWKISVFWGRNLPDHLFFFHTGQKNLLPPANIWLLSSVWTCPILQESLVFIVFTSDRLWCEHNTRANTFIYSPFQARCCDVMSVSFLMSLHPSLSSCSNIVQMSPS